MTSVTGRLGVLPAEHRRKLMSLGRDVSFHAGARIFEEGWKADRFWIIRSGTVQLDLRAPGRRPAVIETLGSGDLLGWSWLFPPRSWHLGAAALSTVRAWEFDAEAVRGLCHENPRLGHAFILVCAEVIGQRLQCARTRLLDLYGPYGSGV
ncbi:cyclic nucleotide-binding domain-containing protein [Streptomyces sp. NPDC000151]|uniref:cyclic nucleotide-binding domain-containing protein n=1 Tax=Streptomyces sp. NPDC000151 TaxID=3154244 RepID=UPI00332D47FA